MLWNNPLDFVQGIIPQYSLRLRRIIILVEILNCTFRCSFILGVFLFTVAMGLPRCKNLTRFSLFVSFCFAVRYCLKCFCFLCFTSSVSFTGSYTEVKPLLCAISLGAPLLR